MEERKCCNRALSPPARKKVLKPSALQVPPCPQLLSRNMDISQFSFIWTQMCFSSLVTSLIYSSNTDSLLCVRLTLGLATKGEEDPSLS